jgi:hypothetical protein
MLLALSSLGYTQKRKARSGRFEITSCAFHIFWGYMSYMLYVLYIYYNYVIIYVSYIYHGFRETIQTHGLVSEYHFLECRMSAGSNEADP